MKVAKQKYPLFFLKELSEDNGHGADSTAECLQTHLNLRNLVADYLYIGLRLICTTHNVRKGVETAC
jgi:hypothetical protein